MNKTKIFEANFRLHVKYNSTGETQYLVFCTFYLVLTKFSLREMKITILQIT